MRGRLLSSDAELADALRAARTIAILGAHEAPHKPAHYVPDDLHHAGWRVLPVNPRFAGEVLWDAPVVERLTSLTEAVDLVDVFRRSAHLPDHLDEILEMEPRPRVVWLQLGIRHAEFTDALLDAGIDVVESRCTLAERRRLGVRGPG